MQNRKKNLSDNLMDRNQNDDDSEISTDELIKMII